MDITPDREVLCYQILTETGKVISGSTVQRVNNLSYLLMNSKKPL